MAKSKQPPPVSGVYAALATPSRANSTEADAAALLDYLDTVVRTGVDGLVLFGSTGEFIHFDVAERMRVLTLAIRRSRVPVLVNVSHSTLAGAIELAQNAMDSGAAGLLLMPPYFYRYTDDQIWAFYGEFLRSAAGGARVYLYNLPFFTNPISPALFERLLTFGGIAGAKDSSGDPRLFHFLRDLRERTRFTLLAGNEALYLEARSRGADGIVSGVAAAVPELLMAMDRAIQTRQTERAARLNVRLQEFVRWVERFPATVAIKQAAAERGWKLNHFAFPVGDDTFAEVQHFRQWLREWLPVVLNECTDAVAMRV